jgi:hypothetical protein
MGHKPKKTSKTDLWKPGGFMDLRRGGVRPRVPTALPGVPKLVLKKFTKKKRG